MLDFFETLEYRMARIAINPMSPTVQNSIATTGLHVFQKLRSSLQTPAPSASRWSWKLSTHILEMALRKLNTSVTSFLQDIVAYKSIFCELISSTLEARGKNITKRRTTYY